MRASGLTFAPEAGTQRMRDVVNKNVTEEHIIETAQRVFSRGWSAHEALLHDRPADRGGRGRARHRRDRRRACRRSAGSYQQRRRGHGVSVARTCPSRTRRSSGARWTPSDEIARKQALLPRRARALRVTLKMHENQAVAHRGHLRARRSPRSADVLEAACRARRALRRLGRAASTLERWRRRRSTRRGVDVGALPRHACRSTARLPWDHIDVGLEDGFLRRGVPQGAEGPAVARRAARPQAAAPPHQPRGRRGRSRGKLVCYDCGVACDLDAMKSERLFYLRRMNAWAAVGARAGGARSRPTAPSATGAGASRRRSRRRARRAGRRRTRYRLRYTKLGRVALPRPPGSRCATCRASSGAPGFELFYSVGLPPQAGAVVRPGAGARASRRWASCSTSRWSTTSRPTSCCAGWRASRWTASSSSRRARLGTTIAPLGRRHRRGGVSRRGCPTASTSRPAFARAGGSEPLHGAARRRRRRSRACRRAQDAARRSRCATTREARAPARLGRRADRCVPDRRQPRGERAADRGADGAVRRGRRGRGRLARRALCGDGRTRSACASASCAAHRRRAPAPRPPRRDRDRGSEQALRRHASPSSELTPARRGGRGDGLPRARTARARRRPSAC